MNTIENQALKIHDYILDRFNKDVPLYICVDALERLGNMANAIEELKTYKMRTH